MQIGPILSQQGKRMLLANRANPPVRQGLIKPGSKAVKMKTVLTDGDNNLEPVGPGSLTLAFTQAVNWQVGRLSTWHHTDRLNRIHDISTPV